MKIEGEGKDLGAGLWAPSIVGGLRNEMGAGDALSGSFNLLCSTGGILGDVPSPIGECGAWLSVVGDISFGNLCSLILCWDEEFAGIDATGPWIDGGRDLTFGGISLGEIVGLGVLLLGNFPWNPKLGVLLPTGESTEVVGDGDIANP